MYATVNGKINIVKLLLDNGANVSETDEHGNTALDLAVLKSNQDIIDLLNSRSKYKGFWLYRIVHMFWPAFLAWL